MIDVRTILNHGKLRPTFAAVALVSFTFAVWPTNADAQLTRPTLIEPFVQQARVTLAWPPTGPQAVPLTGVRVEAGSARGLSDLVVADISTLQYIHVFDNVPAGTYYVRVRLLAGAQVSEASNERVVTVTGCSPPPAPANLVGAYLPLGLTLSWSADSSPCPATSYVIEAGSASGMSDLAVVPVTGTSARFASVPAGVYYVRVRGRNVHGLGATTPEMIATIADPCLPPQGVANFRASTLGNSVSFSWNIAVPPLPPPGTMPTSSHPADVAIEAGSGPGASDLAVIALGPTVPTSPTTYWAPPGTYWVRARHANACGAILRGEDVLITLTSDCVAPDPPQLADFFGSTTGSAVSWRRATGGAVASAYRVDIGTAPGLADILSVRSQAAPDGAGLSTFAQAAPGTYWARVVAENVCGASLPSRSVRAILAPACAQPPAPLANAVVNGQSVTFLLPAPLSVPSLHVYRVEIGTVPGGSDVTTIEPATETPIALPPGHYYARVTREPSSTSCPSSNPSAEIAFTIPPP